MKTPQSQEMNAGLLDRKIGFVGKLGGMNRRELKQLVKQHGGIVADSVDSTVDLVVVGEHVLASDDVQLDDPELSERAAGGRLEVMTETEFWQALGLVDEEYDACRLYTPTMLAELLGIPVATIRRWHRRGLIRPVRKVHKLPYFDFQEVASARKIADLIASGASPSAIESKLSKLAALFPNLQRPLSQLSVIVEGRSLLLREGDGLVEPGGQKRFDFDEVHEAVSDDQAEVIQIEAAIADRDLDSLKTRDDFLRLAIEFEDKEEIESACQVYRSLLLAFGPSPDICFRLAENLFHIGDLTAARERYYSAIELDEQFVEARASLGCLLVELDKPELAISAFQGALEHHSDYPDVMYHLARQLDEVGRSEEADEHWRNFLALAPKSPWADEARDRLGIDS
ncbi:MAG: MerR family transcriptional regulator [Planctomycetota bacterium]